MPEITPEMNTVDGSVSYTFGIDVDEEILPEVGTIEHVRLNGVLFTRSTLALAAAGKMQEFIEGIAKHCSGECFKCADVDICDSRAASVFLEKHHL